jgi:hypothetical protein
MQLLFLFLFCIQKAKLSSGRSLRVQPRRVAGMQLRRSVAGELGSTVVAGSSNPSKPEAN